MIGVVFDKQYPVLENAEDAEAFVAARVAEGADYFKLMIEDGTIFGHEAPGCPTTWSTPSSRRHMRRA
ncbi:hypothetical protein GCM10020255_005100 [Rhodococcus baikonurensis]